MANGDLLPAPPNLPKGTTATATGDNGCCRVSPAKTYELTACSISYTKSANTGSTRFSFLKNLASCSPESASATYILRDVSFTARPGELLAIVGPSGAGKSTLLDILAARTAPTSGTLLLNATPLRPSSYRKISAHVPQHDLAFPHLTVRETFAFAASLLLPGSDPGSREEAVSTLLAELNLFRVANSRLSDNLSGGERRRVSLGLSLLRDPAVLLLDEPTSGLDSSSAYGVMRALRALAGSRRRTVVVSIHQPSFKILATIDSILLLSRGTVLHHGGMASLEASLVTRGFSIPPQLNPLEYAMEINTQLHQQQLETGAKAADDSSTTVSDDVADENVVGIKSPKASTTNDISCSANQKRAAPSDDVVVLYRSSRFHEIAMLYLRFWKIVVRTRQLLLTNALEAVGVGLVLGTIYIHLGFDEQGVEKRLGLLAFTLTFLLSSTVEALPIFVNERPILLREASSGLYRVSSHVTATTLVFLPYLLALSLAYSAAVYFLAGLCPAWTAFGYFVLVVWTVVLMANSFVLFISSLAPNYIAGTSLITVSLAGFFLFSGYFLAGVPKYWLFMRYLSLYKWALDALVANEYWCAGMVGRCFSRATAAGGEGCAVTGADILEEKGLTEGQRWTNVHIMLGYFLLYRVLYWAVLARRVSTSKK